MTENIRHPSAPLHEAKFITVVSGLPRSGTSMMMKMLRAGGMEPLVDNIRTADLDNPNGYFEYERVKKLQQGDHAWLTDAQGKAVKIIATLLPYLPPNFEYRIIFMQREMQEIIFSQQKMLERHGDDRTEDAQELSKLFEKHLQQINNWIQNQPCITRKNVNYNQLIQEPASIIQNLCAFLDYKVNPEMMLSVIDTGLYHQRVNVTFP